MSQSLPLKPSYASSVGERKVEPSVFELDVFGITKLRVVVGEETPRPCRSKHSALSPLSPRPVALSFHGTARRAEAARTTNHYLANVTQTKWQSK